MCGTAVALSTIQEFVDIGIPFGQAILIHYHVSRMHTTSYRKDGQVSNDLTISPTPPSNSIHPTNQLNILLQKAAEKGGYFGFLDEKIFNLDYEVIERIGIGSFGQVLKVKNNVNGCIRAVKKISISEENPITKAILEVITLVSRDNVFLCIEMEYVENGSLRTCFIDKKIFPSVNQVYKIIRDICKGLEMLHHCRILHRDIKPENILVPQIEGLVKVYLADFGLAKPISENSTLGSSLVGTDTCVAPELINSPDDRAIPYSTSSDIFSLGATSYQIMTGDFKSKMATMVYNPSLIRNNLKSLNNNAYPQVLIELVMKMLEEKPENRITIENIISYCDNNGKDLVEAKIITPQEKLEVIHVAITFQNVPPSFDATCLITNNQSLQQNVIVIRIELQKWIEKPQLSITYDRAKQTRFRGFNTERKSYYKYRTYVPYYPVFQIECVNECGELFNVVYADTSMRYLIDVGGSEYMETPQPPPAYPFEKISTLPLAENLPLVLKLTK